MADRTPAEVFPPGDFIREELEERGWTQGDLARILGRRVETVNRLVTAQSKITPKVARELGEAFGTSAELWLNLETAYRLSLVPHSGSSEVARRARLHEIAPVKDMIKRGWIKDTNDVARLESQVMQFLGTESLAETPSITVAARKSTAYTEHSKEQVAWFCRTRQLAKGMAVKPFRKDRLASVVEQIKACAGHPEEIRRIPRMLADAGIRFVIVEHLSGSRIDGASFWLDRKSPVIAISLRYDRIDWFWHTLLHELGHIHNGDDGSIDSDLLGDHDAEVRSQEEVSADEFACSTLIDPYELADFIIRVKPLYSKARISGFAKRMGVHPGIVVGQLQHRKEIDYSHSREMLVKIRDLIIASALTDGWGHVAKA